MAHAEPVIDLTEDTLGIRFTQKGAARACGVALNTIKRRRVNGAFPNAVCDDAGIWQIPLADLLAAGLTPGKPTEPDDAPGPPRSSATESTVAELTATVDGLRYQLAEREARIHETKANAERQIELMAGQVRAIEARAADADQRMTDLRTASQTAVQTAKAASRSATERAEHAEQTVWRWQLLALVASALATAGLVLAFIAATKQR